jgi:RNA polymerase sigma factor (sigma-70 family)
MAPAKVLSLYTPEMQRMGDPELHELARSAALGSQDLERLVGVLQNHPRLRALAARLGRSLHPLGPEDLMQSTLERVVRGISSFRAEGDLLGWVGRIMRNAQIELLRKEASEQVKRTGYEQERRDEERIGDPSELLVEVELQRAALLAWTRNSADPDVRLFWERVHGGSTVEQIMQQTGQPRSTVYLKLKRGGDKLLREFRQLTRGSQ